MKRLFIIILFVSCCLRLNSQSVNFNYSVGYGTYSLADIKQFQKYFLGAMSALPLKAVNTFPPYLFYLAQIEFGATKNLFAGFDGGFYSTGGRNHLADYSGEYRFDMALRSFRAGVHLKYRMPWVKSETSRVSIFTSLSSGVMISQFRTEESMIIYNLDPAYYRYKFNSNVLFIEPSVVLNYKFFKTFSVNLDLGWEADIKSKLLTSDNKNIWLQFVNGKPVCLNWSGVRISLGLSYSFIPKNSE